MPSDPSPAVPTRPARPLLAVVALCLGGLTASLTQTLVIPIQGELPRLLSTSPAQASWVVTITLLAGAVSMPVSGRLADLLGKRRVLVATAGLLAAGSMVCALADTLAPMLVGRALQGCAMGFIPVGISLLRQSMPPDLAGTAISAMSATLGVGGALGLPLSAWVVQTFDWHLLFWGSAVLAALIVLTVLALVPVDGLRAPGRIDAAGTLGLAAGLVAVLLGITQGAAWGWGSPRTLGAVLGGVVVLLAWGRHQLSRQDPLVDLRVSARRPVLLTNLAALAIGFGMMAQAIVVPQLLQLPAATGYGLGQSMLEAGLWMAPGGLVMMAFAPLCGHLIAVTGARRTLMLAAGVLGAGYLVALVLMAAPWQLLVATCVISAGVGLGYAAMPTLILDEVPPTEAGSAVGVNSLMRSVGTTAASAVMAAVLAASAGASGVPSEAAFRWCFAIGAAAALVGLALTLLVPVRARAAVSRETARV